MHFKEKSQNAADKSNGAVLSVQWGGFYTSKEDGKYGLFRLLDFNKVAYHIQLFQEKFDHAPSFEEIKELKPYMWHAPLALDGLQNLHELNLIGHESLDEQALMGYEEYLRLMGVDEPRIKEMVKRLVEYSSQGPMRVRLSKTGDQVIVTPIE